jgi:thioesterase III
MHQEINRVDNGKRIADADFTFVLLDSRTGRTMSIEDDLRETLKPLVLEPESQVG